MRCLKWLPAIDQTGTTSLKAAYECRGLRDQFLISSQLPIVRTFVTPEWMKCLGWDNILSGQALISQLEWGTQHGDSDVVNAVLTYISQNGLTEELANQLASLPCVLSSNDTFVAPPDVFRPLGRSLGGYERLQPYVVEVKRSFWRNHRELLIKIKVRDQIQLADLMKVQAILEAKAVLEESDIGVAIEILNIACRLPRDSLVELKVIDKHGVYHPIHQIYFDDLDFLKPKEKFHLTHPEIPRKTIEKLGIESLRDKCLKGDLEIEDIDDDDEFYQRESEATRIADTLDR
jgi:sacsin